MSINCSSCKKDAIVKDGEIPFCIACYKKLIHERNKNNARIPRK